MLRVRLQKAAALKMSGRNEILSVFSFASRGPALGGPWSVYASGR